MFTRQKALLQLVRLAGGRVDRLVLTKWAFLTRHETESRGGESFYDFLPYHYGPFSFGLYQEADKLVSLGYLREEGPSAWALGDQLPPSVDSRLQQDLVRTADRFREMTVDELLDYVYVGHPRFTINSKRKRLAERKVAPLAVYTAGYEGKSIDAFLNGLIENGIMHLIDVRMNPVARRYGFHRSTLTRLTERLGIRYSHVPTLGIPSESRQHLESPDDYDALFEIYEATTLKVERPAIHMVSEWMRESPSVLVCMEASATSCHRSRLATSVSEATGLPIVNLEL